MRVSHKVDYGVRAMVAIAAEAAVAPGRPVKRAALAAGHGLPPGFLDDILRGLRSAQLLRSVRGSSGGWLLARPAEAISAADVIRALEGPLASVRGIRPHELPGADEGDPLALLWIAVRTALRSVLEAVTIADLAAGRLPPAVALLASHPDSWDPRSPRP